MPALRRLTARGGWRRAKLLARGVLAAIAAVVCAVLGPACSSGRVDDDAVRVATIGDSITYGDGAGDPQRDSYPAQLGGLLGDGYAVRNFGVSGATVLREGDNPIWEERALEDAMRFGPQIVVVLFGTNATRSPNAERIDEFARDYEALVERLSELPSRPAVLIAFPPPAFSEVFGIRDEGISGTVIPALREIAGRRGLATVDLYAALAGHAELLPDGVHPNTEGARVIAEAVADTIAGLDAGELADGP